MFGIERLREQLDRIEARLLAGDDRFERVEGKLDELATQQEHHEQEQNGHKPRTFKGLSFTQWIVVFLLTALVGADLVVDVMSRVAPVVGGGG